MSLLEISHLTKRYDKNTVLDDISLSLEGGRIIGLLGQNGAGKSTLIKLICDLLCRTEGDITVCGEPIGVESKRRIAYLPERTYLKGYMSVEEALRYFATFYDNFNVERARALLADLKLDPAQKLQKMSKGMQEKVQLVLVMSRDADLYLLDEPLGGVDPATRDYILDTILKNFREGASVLLSTHLIGDIERILDEVVILKDHKILLHENCDTLREREGVSLDEYFRRTFKC